MLISPAEPSSIRALGTVSSRCEERGVDILLPAYNLGPVGVQRKEISDLLASVYDGRLSREIAQMAQLRVKVLLIEGRIRWTTDGFLLSSNRSWTRSQHDGLIWSAQLQGVWIASSSDLDDTIQWLQRFSRWCLKRTHTGLLGRVGPKAGEWGQVGSQEWAMHLLQGFNALGPERAERIYEHFGTVPLAWTVTEKDLCEVESIGPKTAQKLIEALGNGKS
ncbi:MAG TPA: ERCC4 domain-containing protein [Acidimicrobiales bacterium]|jgi:ERCC4-type nuclease|nr:ERCC4 domain-containing protein [Acidimicrobiales bacterium]